MDEPYVKLNLFDLMILTFGIPIEIYLKNDARFQRESRERWL